MGTRKWDISLNSSALIVQEVIEAYTDDGDLEYDLGNDAAAVAGSQFKNSCVIRQFAQQELAGWLQVPLVARQDLV